MRNILRMKKPIDTLVAGNKCAKKNRENDDDAGKVLYPTIAKGKPLVGSLAANRNAMPNGIAVAASPKL